ncbi:MAG: L-threonylcarbamoyladenylate synthase [Thermodesulfovibrionales bacterium]|nr:L-threonylcarbamoyladenylate synthase [Thermodesulfovibrionales bacterium]
MLIALSENNYNDVLIRAKEVLIKGGIIAYPTETLYGLGAKYDNEGALEKIFSLKNRPEEKALTLIIGNVEQLSLITDSITPIAQELIRTYWPGPLTLVFKAKEGLSERLKINNTVAARVPGDSFALRLAKIVNFPITATSANISNLPAAQDVETILSYFDEKIDLIIDGGKSPTIQPSTIVDVSKDEPILIREGIVDLKSFLISKRPINVKSPLKSK